MSQVRPSQLIRPIQTNQPADTVKTLSRLTRYALHPAYAIGQRLSLAGINPEAAAMAAIFATVIGLAAIAITAQDRAFIIGCTNAGGSPELCTLKVSGR